MIMNSSNRSDCEIYKTKRTSAKAKQEYTKSVSFLYLLPRLFKEQEKSVPSDIDSLKKKVTISIKSKGCTSNLSLHKCKK